VPVSGSRLCAVWEKKGEEGGEQALSTEKRTPEIGCLTLREGEKGEKVAGKEEGGGDDFFFTLERRNRRGGEGNHSLLTQSTYP